MKRHKRREIQTAVKDRIDIHRKMLVKITHQFNRNIWQTIETMVELYGFQVTGRILGVSYSYLWQVIVGNHEPSKRFMERVKEGLEKWLSEIEVPEEDFKLMADAVEWEEKLEA